jgi:hypothetical protein
MEYPSKNDSLLRVDRAQTRKYYDSPLGRLADNRDGSWGDLFLTADGLVIFAPAHESGPSWTVPLDEISEATDARNYGSPIPIILSGTALRAKFGKVTRTVVFSGLLPGFQMNTLDKAMAKLPTHHTAGLGKMYVIARMEYMQRVTLPKVDGSPSSPTGRAREARNWWLEMLTAPISPDTAEAPTRPWHGVLPADLMPLHVAGATKHRLQMLASLVRMLPADEPILRVFGVSIRARNNWKHVGLMAIGMSHFTIFADMTPKNPYFYRLREKYESITSITTRRSQLLWCAVDVGVRSGPDTETVEIVENPKDHNDAITVALEERRSS